ncbi:hypothetical protein AB4440_00645 [Vibrio splendidus]|uniref:hypothetical protein n=1 Tax=Vibrio splendidus TaxID=29497 RepID=UPI000C83BC26|nr:hypothetical protein [Vibrio splendidus]PMO98395.1 hypothetical protein BCS97_08200 [Vibrio splendidus]PMP32374.1 hypothetical protein BCS88_15230 [Vibrio splendidus]PMP33832.1 hypothetical protein BCS89_23410 [Vibrio splendidus]PMP39955.1 hypothetical protein BCS87_08880 [Vibrio splendidus]PMP49889.1 hypothetical protein BCS83_21770 [Vibrio splendidus]
MRNFVNVSNQEEKSRHQLFLEQLEKHGGDSKEIFTTKQEYINETYGCRWKLSNTSTRGQSTDLNRVYNLDLSFTETQKLLRLFKLWAQTKAPGTTDSRIGVICKVIQNYGGDVIRDASYLKSIYGSLTLAYKKNINYLFYGLYEKLKIKSYKEHRKWAKDNLESEKINPHDPVNGAYSDYQYNEFIDFALTDLSIKRTRWQSEKTSTKFVNYSSCIFRILSLITSRRAAQFNQSKVCDVLNYSENKPEIMMDGQIAEIQFYKSKTGSSSFRAVSEKSRFPLSEYFTNIIVSYLIDLKDMIKELCSEYDYSFDEVPWKYYPLFPDFVSMKSEADLKSPQLHNDSFHRSLGGTSTTTESKFSITRIRHTTATRGMEAGLNLIQIARLTGVTTAATRNYKDLTPQSRKLINKRFCKSELLKKSFGWSIAEYNDSFPKIHSDQYGNKVGEVKDEIGCRTCLKKLSAPLGCYSCGADLFVPFVDADHQVQLNKAIAKQKFLDATGANQHQIFEINVIIQRIKKVIEVQKNYLNGLLENSNE